MSEDIKQLKIASLTNEIHRLRRLVDAYKYVIDILRKRDEYESPALFWAEIEYRMKFLQRVEEGK